MKRILINCFGKGMFMNCLQRFQFSLRNSISFCGLMYSKEPDEFLNQQISGLIRYDQNARFTESIEDIVKGSCRIIKGFYISGSAETGLADGYTSGEFVESRCVRSGSSEYARIDSVL